MKYAKELPYGYNSRHYYLSNSNKDIRWRFVLLQRMVSTPHWKVNLDYTKVKILGDPL